MITIITHIIVVITLIRAKNVVFDVQKKLYNLPELGGGGGVEEVIWAMPERKHSFLQEVFPNNKKQSCFPIFEKLESAADTCGE